ncbi:MAG: PHP domain-containing protein [Anaerolineae bacterium]|jgi:predicted metal-dependent phosphoesterase TrpH|nr:PHP domain-containing protein [Anaerolineae bacterium]MDH7473419.1 PHP domain-containing protein [Anaerolineae bacterium]
MIKIDCHIHTCYSPDSLNSPQAVIAACCRRGLDKIVVADHNTIAGALALRELAPDLVIVGEEIKTTNGELIALFVEEEVPAWLPLEEAIARLRAQGAIIGVSHPLESLRREAMGREALMTIIGRVDFLEGFNARCILPGDNRRALALAREHGLPVTAGSDAHSPMEIGAAYVEMPPFTNKEDFLSSLRQARIGGHLSCPLVHFISTWAKMRGKIPMTKFYLDVANTRLQPSMGSSMRLRGDNKSHPFWHFGRGQCGEDRWGRIQERLHLQNEHRPEGSS